MVDESPSTVSARSRESVFPDRQPDTLRNPKKVPSLGGKFHTYFDHVEAAVGSDPAQESQSESDFQVSYHWAGAARPDHDEESAISLPFPPKGRAHAPLLPGGRDDGGTPAVHLIRPSLPHD